ncbi:hypothetical protein ACFYW8_35560 [Streptomyces sp. NPDC002742]|uniref:hypothetical protein n=1 Tax=Streptomyces sp. NPDC002742 TaxID=3364663 RepID=UPI003698B117
MRAAGVAVRHVPGEGLVHGYFLMQGIVPAAAACARRVSRALDMLLNPQDVEAASSLPRGDPGDR